MTHVGVPHLFYFPWCPARPPRYVSLMQSNLRLPEHEMPELAILGQPVSPVEVIAAVTGLLSVWFVLKLNQLTWPLGIVSVGCYALVFFEAKLYADALLQLAFVVASAHGWQQWRKCGSSAAVDIRVLTGARNERLAALGGGLMGTAAVGLVLARLTDSPAPFADAAVFTLSLLATLLQARRRIEGWWYWILVDLISVPLYWSRSLHLTTALYLIFLVMAFIGLRAWLTRLQAQQA